MNRLGFALAGFLLLTGVPSAIAQGGYYEVSAIFGNRIPGILDAPVYAQSLGPQDWEHAKSGNTPTGFPPGAQSYGGPLLEGWNIAFAAAPGHVEDPHDLFFVGEVMLTLGTGANAGYFETSRVWFAFPWTETKATFGTVQARVWHGIKAPDIWLHSASTGLELVGASSLFTVEFGEDKIATDLRSFSVGFLGEDWLPRPIPEPSAAALSILSLFIYLGMRKRQGTRA